MLCRDLFSHIPTHSEGTNFVYGRPKIYQSNCSPVGCAVAKFEGRNVFRSVGTIREHSEMFEATIANLT